MNPIPSPVAADGMVFVTSGFRGNNLKAIRLADARGDITGSSAIAWTLDRDTPYVPSPLLYDGILYFLKTQLRHPVGVRREDRQRRTIRCSGSTAWPKCSRRRSAPPAASTSPIATGTTLVIRHGAEVRSAREEHAGRRVRRVAGARRRRHLPARVQVPLQHRRELKPALSSRRHERSTTKRVFVTLRDLRDLRDGFRA